MNKINQIIRAYRYYNRIKSQNIYKNVNSIDTIFLKNSNLFNKGIIPNQEGEFEGKIINNKKNGFGIKKWENKSKNSISKFIGIFYENEVNGNGKYITITNNTIQISFEGEFINNKANGYGIYKINKKGFYEGEWENDLQNNIGIEEWNDGSLYKGEFKNGKKCGIGTYIWNDGAKYYGEWNNNFINGWGVYFFKDGKIYLGEWINNEMNGYGEMIWNKSKIYIGFFIRNKRCGFGIIIWREKEKGYVGFWKDNFQNGIGKFVSNNHNKKEVYGVWSSGIKEKTLNKDEFYDLIENNENVKRYKEYFKYGYKALDMLISFYKMK